MYSTCEVKTVISILIINRLTHILQNLNLTLTFQIRRDI